MTGSSRTKAPRTDAVPLSGTGPDVGRRKKKGGIPGGKGKKKKEKKKKRGRTPRDRPKNAKKKRPENPGCFPTEKDQKRGGKAIGDETVGRNPPRGKGKEKGKGARVGER